MPDYELIIRNARIIDGTGGVIENGTVVVQDERPDPAAQETIARGPVNPPHRFELTRRSPARIGTHVEECLAIDEPGRQLVTPGRSSGAAA